MAYSLQIDTPESLNIYFFSPQTLAHLLPQGICEGRVDWSSTPRVSHRTMTLTAEFDSSLHVEDITRWREDMNFIFEWQNNILRTSAASE